MQFYQETERLNYVESALNSIPFQFGPNKNQQLTRLIYEVSKRDNQEPKVLLKNALDNEKNQTAKETFAYLKDYFLKKRFPNIYKNQNGLRFYLPKVNFNPQFVVKKEKLDFHPEKIIIEEDIKNYALTKSILDKFKDAEVVYINYIGDYIKSRQNKFTIKDYNLRLKNLFLIKERFDFVKPCPCSKGVLGCGYYILNIGFGCPYECSYCFLQSYTNTGGIILPVNIEDFLKKIEEFSKNNKRSIRIGTGEFTDSLALDDLTNFSKILIEFFARFKNITLELKTKSNNIKNILNLNHKKKTVISWSLNPQEIIDSDEWASSSLTERLDAARACCQVGYPVGFHFDPIIYSGNWKSLYRDVMDKLFNKVNSENIAWISLGTFRFVPKLKTIIEQRFPQSDILDAELAIGFDKKLRYSQSQRVEIYKEMFSWIKSHSNSTLVYLCMERREIWREVLGVLSQVCSKRERT